MRGVGMSLLTLLDCPCCVSSVLIHDGTYLLLRVRHPVSGSVATWPFRGKIRKPSPGKSMVGEPHLSCFRSCATEPTPAHDQENTEGVEAGDEALTAAEQCDTLAASSPHRQGQLPLHDLLSNI